MEKGTKGIPGPGHLGGGVKHCCYQKDCDARQQRWVVKAQSSEEVRPSGLQGPEPIRGEIKGAMCLRAFKGQGWI